MCTVCWPHPFWTPSEERNRRKKKADPTKKKLRKKPGLAFMEYLDAMEYAEKCVPY